MRIRFEYDESVDAAYIAIASDVTPGAAVVQRSLGEESPDIYLDFDARGHLLGIEILGVKSVLGERVLVQLLED
jgi:uncharacterized protein YuzE